MPDRDTSIPGNQIQDDSINQTELDITNIPTDGQIIKINMPAGDMTAIDLPAGGGDVTAGSNITDNAVVRGDGGAKGVQESTASITDSGEMTNTSQPAFLVLSNTGQNNLTTGVLHTILYQNERFDQGSNFNSTTGIFTAPVTGRYQFNVLVQLLDVDNAATFIDFIIFTSNLGYQIQISPDDFISVDTVYGDTYSLLVDMDANDTAEFRIRITGGAAQTDVQSSANAFSGYLVT